MKRIILIIVPVILFTACSSNEDKELFDSASVKYNTNDFAGAVSDYEKILTEYPNSQFAEDSYFAAAGIYQMNKVPGLSKEESAKKAVEYFQKYYKQFPNSERTPKALFLIGFIQANDLRELESAGNVYREFLEKYPRHELAASVKLELDNLGKSPEEIIEQKLSASK